jgi:hypothetical protein
MTEPMIQLCPECGHAWAEHSKLNGCESEPFCWCHLADPSAVKAELDEFKDGPGEQDKAGRDA